MLRRIALLRRITALLRGVALLRRVALLLRRVALLLVSHLGRPLLVVALLLLALVWILLTTICRGRGGGRLSVGRRLVLLVGHLDGFSVD